MGVLGFISIILTCVASCSMNISIERLSVTNYHNINGIPKAVYIKYLEDVSSEHISTRIIGGTFVHISEIPYQVRTIFRFNYGKLYYRFPIICILISLIKPSLAGTLWLFLDISFLSCGFISLVTYQALMSESLSRLKFSDTAFIMTTISN